MKGSLPLLSLVLALQIPSCGTSEDAANPPVRHAAITTASRLDALLGARLDTPTRSRELGRFFAAAVPEDLDRIRMSFDAAAAYLHPSDLELFAAWWAGFDPEGAMRDPRAGATIHTDFWKIQVLRTWAAHAPLDARDAYPDGACPESNDRCLLALVSGWYASGDAGVWSFVEGLPLGVLRQRAMDVLAGSLIAEHGVEEAIRFAEALDPGAPRRFKLQFHRRLVTAVALRDVDRASRWAEERAESPFGDGLLRRVAVRAVARDGPATMAWLFSLPVGTQRDEAVREAARRWLREDAASALGWFERLGDWSAIQPALGVFAMIVARDDPEGGLALVDRIEDSRDRETALVAVLRSWVDRSPLEANDWIGRADLGRDLEARIRAEPSKRRRRGQPG